MSRPASSLVSPQEYLEAERRAETKSEYYDGEIVALSGASREHNLLTVNITALLHGQLRGRPCEVYAADMRVRTSRTGAYVYPDVAVACGRPELEDEHLDTLLNPTVLFEVLSPSTESNDRGRKWDRYRRIPSLQEYLLVAQDRPRIEQYVRQEGGLWLFREADGPEAVVDLPAIGCALRLAEVYERVQFETP